LRLRTACDLTLNGAPAVTRPNSFALPLLNEIEKDLPACIAKVREEKKFNANAVGVTNVTYEK
jgi:hypothetical protein